jgi:hypothetical protein
MYTDMRKPQQNDVGLIRASLGNPETGQQLGSSVPNGTVFIPGGPVTLQPGDALSWEVHWKKVTFKTPTCGMFDSFIKLWDEADERIRQFAERWGPLSIQGDGSHLGALDIDPIDPWISRGVDDLKAWRYFSRRAYAVLKLASKLTRGEPGDETDWEIIASPHPPGPARRNVCAVSPFRMPNHPRRRQFISANGLEYGEPLDLEGKRRVIAAEIHAWLEKFGVTLTMNWGPRFSWQLEIFYRNWLLSAIALQLALRVMRADGLFVCSGCDRLYGRIGRRPNTGDKNYCPRCGRATAVEEAGRRLRQKRADARRFHREGKSAVEIARLLKVRKVETVRGWISKGKRA